MKLADIPRRDFKKGGSVKGSGGETDDSVKANLSHGEFVMPADSVRALGVDHLESLRQMTHNPGVIGPPGGYAAGGLVEDPLKPKRPTVFGDAAAGALDPSLKVIAPTPASPVMPSPVSQANPNYAPAQFNTPAATYPQMGTGSAAPQTQNHIPNAPALTPPTPGGTKPTNYSDGTMTNTAPAAGAAPAPIVPPVPSLSNPASLAPAGPTPPPTTGQTPTPGPLPLTRESLIADMSGANPNFPPPQFTQPGTPATLKNMDAARDAKPLAVAAVPNLGSPNVGSPLASELVPGATEAVPAAPAAPAAPNITGPAVANQENIAQDLRSAAHSRYMSDRSLEEANKGTFGPTPGLGIIDGIQADARQKFFDEANLRSAAAKGVFNPRAKNPYQSDEAAIKAASIPIAARAEQEKQSLRNQGELARERIQGETTRRGQDVLAKNAERTDATTRYGHDVTDRGHTLTAKTAAAKALLDQGNADRNYNLEVDKFGNTTRAQNLESRGKADDQYRKRLESQYTKDGKVDAEAVGTRFRGMQLALGKKERDLQAQASDPRLTDAQRKDAQKELSVIYRDGPDALSASDRSTVELGSSVRDAVNNAITAGYNPLGSNAQRSDDPVEYLTPIRTATGVDYAINGDPKQVVPKRFLTDIPDWKRLVRTDEKKE